MKKIFLQKIPPVEKEFLGILLASFAFMIWGGVPLIWQLLKHVSAEEAIAERIIWAFFSLFLVVMCRKHDRAIFFSRLKSFEQLSSHAVSGLIIGCNWYTFVWAVNHERVLESSLGYFISPIISVVFGVIFFKEKLSLAQKIGLVFIAIGVLWAVFSFDTLPFVALTLALTFSIYGVLVKKQHTPSMVGVCLEAMILLPFALAYIIKLQMAGQSHFGLGDPKTTLEFILVGVVTAIPLVLYGAGTKLMPLSYLGFIQYLSPTLQFLSATVVLHEKVHATKLLSFSLVWFGILFFLFEVYKKVRKPR